METCVNLLNSASRYYLPYCNVTRPEMYRLFDDIWRSRNGKSHGEIPKYRASLPYFLIQWVQTAALPFCHSFSCNASMAMHSFWPPQHTRGGVLSWLCVCKRLETCQFRGLNSWRKSARCACLITVYPHPRQTQHCKLASLNSVHLMKRSVAAVIILPTCLGRQSQPHTTASHSRARLTQPWIKLENRTSEPTHESSPRPPLFFFQFSLIYLLEKFKMWNVCSFCTRVESSCCCYLLFVTRSLFNTWETLKMVSFLARRN